jgi:G:T/U-mismatch repair DNA glycosylase
MTNIVPGLSKRAKEHCFANIQNRFDIQYDNKIKELIYTAKQIDKDS